MTFFTRVNTNVPFLPSDECHSDSSTLKKNEDSTSCTNNTSDNSSEVKDVASDNGKTNKEQGRYEYVVDRVLGVEV